MRAAIVFALAVTAALSGGAATASADSLGVQTFGLPIEYSDFLAPTSRESGANKIRFNLFNNSGADVAAGTVVKLTPRPVSDPGVIPDPAGATITVPPAWAQNMSAVGDTTVNWNGSGPLSKRDVTVTYDVDYTCANGGTSCVPSTVPRTFHIQTRPEPPTNHAVHADGNDLVMTWDLSADDSRITDYGTSWSRFEMDGSYPTDQTRRHDGNGSAPRGTTSWRLENLPPDRKYCMQVTARYRLGTGVFDQVGAGTPELACALSNRSPRDIGAPSAPRAISADGAYTVQWDEAHDPDGHGITYELEHRDHDDLAWSSVQGDLHSGSRAVAEDEGTWRYRVRATDEHGVSGEWVESQPVVVDKTAPEVRATTIPAQPAFDRWFADEVIVSFAESVDPSLADTSPGSGIKSLTDPVPLGHGDHTVPGVAVDSADHRSEVDKSVSVDASHPHVEIVDCPTAPVRTDSEVWVEWRASDTGSGLRTAAGGSLKLDTSADSEGRAVSPEAEDNVGHVTSGAVCEFEVNSPPTTPGAPNGPEVTRDGSVALGWAPATDPDQDEVKYVVAQRDHNDADWNELSARPTVPELTADVAEGTWKFQVKAVDSHGAESAWSPVSAAVVVDQSAPTSPATSTTTPADPVHDGWFKNEVTVEFGGSSDPALDDTSDGSGVAGYSSARFTESGTHPAFGTATDEAGNKSPATERTVKVDATAPKAQLACPTQAVTVGDPGATARWTATDEHSGVKGEAGRDVPLDTSKPGTYPVSGPAPEDNVGHTGQAPECTYTVAYKFAGFLSPINGDAVNVGKTGRTYPIKWRLQRHDGSLISDTEAQALVPAMAASQRQVDCYSGIQETAALEDVATGGTALRYDAAADQFIYHYAAPQTLGCYVLGVRNTDGANTKQVNFRFTR